ncbi:hypothetical protein VTP01DRAFT_324 [Rhizomucor pusillus]|uniref:uncharacterized protein n=1 Tax=Rhizomucor pusillus TaxID=4840 RepID=UPI0037439A1F
MGASLLSVGYRPLTSLHLPPSLSAVPHLNYMTANKNWYLTALSGPHAQTLDPVLLSFGLKLLILLEYNAFRNRL